jgi:hypothetical protein
MAYARQFQYLVDLSAEFFVREHFSYLKDIKDIVSSHNAFGSSKFRGEP